MPQQKPKLEEIATYPAGRGKVLIIAKKSMPKKPQKSPSPRHTHYYLKSNPEPISLVEYQNNDRKAIYLFPEGRKMEYEERLKLAAALIATLPKNYKKRVKCMDTRHVVRTVSNNREPPIVTKELRQEVKRQRRRYQKWLQKNS